MAVLLKAESFPTEGGCKLSRGTSSQLGMHGTGGAMRQAEMVWAEWGIRPKVRKQVDV